jgi:hypothetical protein
MIRISITQAAFDAIAPLPFGSVGYEPVLTTKGERLIWVDARAIDKLDALRGPSEGLKLVEIKARRRL